MPEGVSKKVVKKPAATVKRLPLLASLARDKSLKKAGLPLDVLVLVAGYVQEDLRIYYALATVTVRGPHFNHVDIHPEQGKALIIEAIKIHVSAECFSRSLEWHPEKYFLRIGDAMIAAGKRVPNACQASVILAFSDMHRNTNDMRNREKHRYNIATVHQAFFSPHFTTRTPMSESIDLEGVQLSVPEITVRQARLKPSR